MKMKFVTPEVELIKFEAIDVIATSNTGTKPGEDDALPEDEV